MRREYSETVGRHDVVDGEYRIIRTTKKNLKTEDGRSRSWLTCTVSPDEHLGRTRREGELELDLRAALTWKERACS
jgi:hypothetical protein